MATLPVAHVHAPSSEILRRSRWLYVVSHTDPRYGGLSAAVPSLAASVSLQENVDVSLAAFCNPGEEARPASFADEQLTFWPTSRKAWLLPGGPKTAFQAAVREVDGLHLHGLWEASTAVGCDIARRLGKPYVLSAHGMLEPWALATKALKKRVYAALVERKNVAGAACLHALTTAEAEQYRRFGATCPIVVIPNAVDIPAQADPELFFAKFPALRGRRLVMFLSRLHPKKGLDLLVEAWSQLAKQHSDALLVIAGPDSEGMQAKLTEQAAARGITDRVVFTGMLAGPMKWSALAAAAGYVLPSYSEGLSMALLEAMGMGLPVLATRACNMPEITTSGAGWEMEATADDVTSSLADFLANSQEQNLAMGRRGAQLIARRYSPAQIARQTAAMYAFALGGPAPEGLLPAAGGAR